MIDCEDIIKKALGRGLTDDEILELKDQAVRLYEKTIAASNSALGLPDIMAASDAWAQKEQLAALARKHNTLRQVKARLSVLDFCLAEFRGMEAEGINALQVGSKYTRDGARSSVDAMGRSLEGEYIGGLTTDIMALGQAHFELLRKNTMGMEIAEALWNVDTQDKFKGPKEAMDIAKVIHKWQEKARLNANAAGAWIGKLPGYVVRQSHDQAKVARAGYDKWRDTIKDKLDWTRTADGVIDPKADPKAAEEFLFETWKGLSTGIHLHNTLPQNPLSTTANIGSTAARMSHERVLHFKSGADWFNYNQQFGRGGLNEAVLHGLRQSAQSTALMRIFGPSPQATLDWVTQHLETILLKRGDTNGATRVKNMRSRLNQNLKILDGSENIDGNIRRAAIGRNIRALQSMTKLGGALISSLSDIPNIGFEFAYHGKGFFKGITEAFHYMLEGRPGVEQMRIASSCGVFFDSMIGNIAARFSDDNLSGKMAAGMNLFFKLNGLSFWTDAWKKSVVLTMAHDLAQIRNTGWRNLSRQRQRALNLYQIDETKWDIIRKANAVMADGRDYLTPDSVRELSDDIVAQHLQKQGKKISPGQIMRTREELATSLQSYFRDRVQYAVLEPDAANRRFLHQGTSAGKVGGEILRYMTQFKSFPTLFMQRTMAREIYGRGADTMGKGLSQIFAKSADGDRSNFAQMFLAMTAMGILAMQAKAIVAGKTPRKLDAKAVLAGAAQGGGMGILGDFLFGDYSRLGSGIIAALAGPVASTAENAARVAYRLRNREDVGAETFRFLINNTPGNNLFWLRGAADYLFLHEMYESINPGYLRRMKRRIKRENNQTFWLDPQKRLSLD